MLKHLAIRLALIFLFAFVLGGCGSNQPTPAKSTPAANLSTGILTPRIIAEGRVVPVTSVTLSFPIGGIVTQLNVAPGERVEAGKVLAQLDSRQLELQVAQADANIAVAQARLKQFGDTPTEQDTLVAQRNLVSAQAALTAAEQNYARVKQGPTAEQLALLQAQADNAQAALAQAQAAYDRIGGASNPDIGRLPQSLQLQQATNNYVAAVSALNDAKNHPTMAELATAQSQVEQARTAVESAKNQIAKLQPSVNDRAVLQANLQAAQAARDLVAAQLKNAQIVAPFAGTITNVDIHVGEFVAPGVMVLRLADAKWQIETTDLTELNIANVREGMTARLTFDALPDLELNGKVIRVKPFGESRQGDIVYTVVILPDQQDARLRWNMTTKVAIESQ